MTLRKHRKNKTFYIRSVEQTVRINADECLVQTRSISEVAVGCSESEVLRGFLFGRSTPEIPPTVEEWLPIHRDAAVKLRWHGRVIVSGCSGD